MFARNRPRNLGREKPQKIAISKRTSTVCESRISTFLRRHIWPKWLNTPTAYFRSGTTYLKLSAQHFFFVIVWEQKEDFQAKRRFSIYKGFQCYKKPIGFSFNPNRRLLCLRMHDKWGFDGSPSRTPKNLGRRGGRSLRRSNPSTNHILGF